MQAKDAGLGGFGGLRGSGLRVLGVQARGFRA